MLEDLGNLGEFIGSIAVLASLLYLARQVHQATKWQRHAAALDRLAVGADGSGGAHWRRS